MTEHTTPRDILEHSKLDCGLRLPYAGWVICHTGFFGHKLQKPILRCQQSEMYYKDSGSSQDGQEAGDIF